MQFAAHNWLSLSVELLAWLIPAAWRSRYC